MANRRLQQFHYSYEVAPTHIYVKVAIGATGAPTLVASTSKGVASIARTGAGAYTLTLVDKFNRLMSFQANFISASAAPAAPGVYVKADNTATTPNVTFVCTNVSGTATDPASGEIMLLDLTLKNSSI